jgi:hypothetical protein
MGCALARNFRPGRFAVEIDVAKHRFALGRALASCEASVVHVGLGEPTFWLTDGIGEDMDVELGALQCPRQRPRRSDDITVAVTQ